MNGTSASAGESAGAMRRAAAVEAPTVAAWRSPRSGWWVAHDAAEVREASSAAELVDRCARSGRGPWWISAAFDAARPWPRTAVARAIRSERVSSMAPVSAASSAPTIRRVREDRAGWRDLVRAALAEIHAGRARKIVAARVVDVELSAAPDLRAVMAFLARRYPAARVFMQQVDADRAWVGATPENLCTVENGLLAADALAGSTTHGSVFTAKEHAEHDVVVDYVRTALMPLCATMQAPSSPQVMHLPNILHLHTPITGALHRGATAAQVVEALHPTPAVCGVPREGALQFIRTHERDARGWYAGPVGLVNGTSVDLGVALRCAVVDGRHARIHVGAGIVAGSDPDAEWAETTRKAMVMMEALGGSAA